MLTRERKPAKEGRFTVKIDKGGYDFTVRVDLRKLGVQEKATDSFYMDLLVGVGALGDAHGSCRVGWNGKLNSSARSEHFALVVPE
jgi:alpha-galactosidase